MPLGGVHEEEAESRPKTAASALPSLAPSVATAAPSEDEDEGQADEVEISAAPSSTPSAPSGKPAAPAAFQVKPWALHQAWTRVVDLEFALKVGPGGSMDMKMTSHQEVRFEVLSVGASGIDKLGIEYSIYKSTLSFMGSSQDSPEELAGKRFVVTFAAGKPDVRDAAGGKPPQKQADSVNDDAREPLEIEKALKELSRLTAQGKGDFSPAGAISLAGGEDDDTKIAGARGSLQRLTTGPSGEKTALVELGYTLTNELDDKSTIEVQVKGTLNVLDAPSRYQSSVLAGPMELRSPDPSGMSGRGTIKVTTSYRY